MPAAHASRWAQELMSRMCSGRQACVEEVWRLCKGRYDCIKTSAAALEAQSAGAGDTLNTLIFPPYVPENLYPETLNI